MKPEAPKTFALACGTETFFSQVQFTVRGSIAEVTRRYRDTLCPGLIPDSADRMDLESARLEYADLHRKGYSPVGTLFRS